MSTKRTQAGVSGKRQPSSSRAASASATGAKLPVAEPTSLGKFCVILIMHLCKKILLFDTTTKLAIYVFCITVLSVITDRFPFPRTYFSDKRNALNQVFVKWGWGWTCTILGIFIYFTSYTYCAGDKKSINRHLSRLAVATSWWFICVRLFDYIHSTVGYCAGSPENITTSGRDACEMAGQRWLAFDVSGHAFLLIHCLLTISEEVHCISSWERIEEITTTEQQKPTERYTSEDLDRVRSAYSWSLPYIRLLIVFLTLLTLLWELMLLATIMYFHNMPQKLTGAAFAAIGWFLAYRVWYLPSVTRLTVWSPGPPGRGLIRYQKDCT